MERQRRFKANRANGFVKLEVIVPTFRSLENAEQILRKIRKNAQGLAGVKVTLTLVATEVPEEELQEFQARNTDVKILKVPRGKVYALNTAVENTDAEALLFIDSDAELVRDDILESVLRELQRYDFGGGAIDINGSSWFQKMAQIDYIGLTAAGMVGKEIGETIGIIGAFLFAKREVLEKTNGFPPYICEDAAFAAIAEEHGYKQGFVIPKVAITGAPRTLKQWLRQRIRWATGDAEVALHLVRWSPKKALLTFMANPAAVVWALAVFGSIGNAYTLAGITMAAIGGFVWSIFPLAAAALFIGGIGFIPLHVLGFLITAAWARHWAEMGGHRKPGIGQLLEYYFFYTPLWLSVIIGGTVRALLGTREIAGWVVPPRDSGLKETAQ